MNECKECSSSAKVISGTETTRRRFLVAMMAIASFLLSVILGIPFIGALVRSNFSSQKQKWVKVADMQSIPEDVPTRLNFTRREQDAFSGADSGAIGLGRNALGLRSDSLFSNLSARGLLLQLE